MAKRLDKGSVIDEGLLSELGRHFINSDAPYPAGKSTLKGIRYYELAYERGDADALEKMRQDLAEAEARRRLREERMHELRILVERRRQKRLEEEKKSYAEKAGELYGELKGVVAEPLGEIARDFQKGADSAEEK